MGARLALRINSEDGALERITAAVEDLGEREAWSPDLVFRINLVLEELGLNAIQYGSKGKTPDIEIVMVSDQDQVTVTISDAGVPFDPLTDAPDPDVDASIEDRPIGGLGVYLVREMMDEAHYKREDGRNHLTLIKRRNE